MKRLKRLRQHLKSVEKLIVSKNGQAFYSRTTQCFLWSLYEIIHINSTSFHCTGRYELNKLTTFPMCGFIAQLVERRTGIAEVTGSNPVEALIFFFFRLLLSNCLNWKIYCDDRISTFSVFYSRYLSNRAFVGVCQVHCLAPL